MTYEELQKLDKKRKYVFAELDKELSIKYNLPPLIINYIRQQSIYYKKGRKEICERIAKAIESRAYETIDVKPKGYKDIPELIEARKLTLAFLLSCLEEEYAEITKLTKWDYDYEGEDKKMPLREEVRQIREQFKSILPSDTATDVPS